MASSGSLNSFLVLLLIISTAKGRWLGLESFSSSSSSSSSSLVASDGIHDMNYRSQGTVPFLSMVVSNSSDSEKLYASKRCESIYGFLPCADTMQEGIFLMVMYMYLMMLGEECIQKGSQALFVLIGPKAIGASVFRVLMALPRIVVVVVSGVLSTPSDARNQVAFGVGMYAGSTVISLTLIWGFRVILSRDKLRGKESIHGHEHTGDSSSRCLPFKQKLSILTDTGVNIDKETGDMAVIMLLSLIPFATVLLAQMFDSPMMILFALIVSAASLLSYFAFQILNPWIQVRSLAYLKQEHLRTRFIYHLQRLAEDDLVDEKGKPNLEAFERIFTTTDTDNDKHISHEELERLLQEMFKLQDDQISKDYAKAEIMTHFDSDESGIIDLHEFQKGCTKWLDKWKNDANNSGSFSKNLWTQVEKIAVNNKRVQLTKIELIMPSILKQVFAKNEFMKDGEPDREKIEELFSKYDKDSNNEICQSELKQFIDTMQFGVSLDHDTVLKELSKDFDKDNDGSIQKTEFVDGFIRWIKRATSHDPSIKDPKHAIEKFQRDSWQEIDSTFIMEKPKASILYVIFGIVVTFVISGAFIQSVIQFSSAAHVPFILTSFVMAPIAMNARMVITALLHGNPHVSKNASLTFSEIYSGLVMNNLLGLSTLLATVYIKGLTWNYSAEVLTIMIPCAVVGLFAFNRCTYPLWTSILAMLLYPISICLFYLLD